MVKPISDRFIFTVTDLARFLGKSAVTLRSWERKGMVSLPRDPNGERKLTIEDIRQTARTAKGLGRINETRLRLVEASMTMLAVIEKENK